MPGFSDRHPNTPHPNDYWAQPERQEAAARTFAHLEQYNSQFLAALGPIADAFVSQETTVPQGWQELALPFNHKQILQGLEGEKYSSLLVFLALDGLVKAKSGGTKYLGLANYMNFEDYGLQGRSITIACGDTADAREISDYAPVALAMEAADRQNVHSMWLRRLPDDVIAQKVAQYEAEQAGRQRQEELKATAANLSLQARQAFLAMILECADQTLDRQLVANRQSGNPYSIAAIVMSALSVTSREHWQNARNLAEVRERAAAGLVADWEKLMLAATAILGEAAVRAALGLPDPQAK